VRTDTFPSANAPSASASSSERGEVLEEILPEVSEKARATIQGVVRVSVRVHVDPTGNVSEASLDSAGPVSISPTLLSKPPAAGILFTRYGRSQRPQRMAHPLQILANRPQGLSNANNAVAFAGEILVAAPRGSRL